MKKSVKQCWKLLLTVMMFVLVLATGVKAQAATWVEINEKNFPDKGARRQFTEEAENSYSGYKYSNGKYYINVSGVTYFYGDESIKNYGFLKKFTRLQIVNIRTKVDSLTLPASVKNVDISESGKKLTLNAPGATSIRIYGSSKTTLKLQNAKKVEDLAIYKIKDVSGLSNLKKLKNLYLSDVQSTSINLTKNTRLTNIEINGALKLASLKCPNGVQSLKAYKTNIIKLNVSGLQNLKILDVAYNNRLYTIDVSKNKKLENLNVSCGIIKSVDVRKNKRLTSLACYEAKLSDLKIGKNSKLKSVDVHSNKKLKDLDIAQCPNMETVNASGTSISQFDAVKYKNIQELYLASTKIKALNVTKCYKLRWLAVSDTAIKTLNVTKNKKLSYFYPSSTSMKVEGLKNRSYLELYYTGLKKGSVVSLKDIIGSGYKLGNKNDNVRFNPKTMKLQAIRKTGYGVGVELVKGNSICYINIYFNN